MAYFMGINFMLRILCLMLLIHLSAGASQQEYQKEANENGIRLISKTEKWEIQKNNDEHIISGCKYKADISAYFWPCVTLTSILIASHLHPKIQGFVGNNNGAYLLNPAAWVSVISFIITFAKLEQNEKDTGDFFCKKIEKRSLYFSKSAAPTNLQAPSKQYDEEIRIVSPSVNQTQTINGFVWIPETSELKKIKNAAEKQIASDGLNENDAFLDAVKKNFDAPFS